MPDRFSWVFTFRLFADGLSIRMFFWEEIIYGHGFDKNDVYY